MKKRLITSALPYVNNVPHLGNVIGSVLSADVFARYCRSAGFETLYVCATDEYGTATESKAREEGKTPGEVCDFYHAVHRKIYREFNIGFDCFGRTSHPEQTEMTQYFYRRLHEKGLLIEKTENQLFCESCDLFLADRFVEGTCPHCDSENARGDQCENCGKLLEPEELKRPRCKFCSKLPVSRSTKHLYLDLPGLKGRLLDFFRRKSEEGHWPKNAASTTRNWLESDLVERPITRDLRWGVPVPREGYEEKVFYVWFDAVLGYLSATKRHLGGDWEKWWKAPESTDLYQFMAKDNIPFHTVILPAMELGTGESWTMLHHIASTEYLNYEDSKFSKSRNVGVFGDDVIQTGIPVDLWRFHLVANRPEKADSKFVWELFFEQVNSEFIDNVGNLLHRVLTFLHRNYGGRWENAVRDGICAEFLSSHDEDLAEAIRLYDRVRLKEALEKTLAMGKNGNRFFQSNEPWKKVKTAPDEAIKVLATLVVVLADVAVLIQPVMPETANRMLKMLNVEGRSLASVKEREIFGSHSVRAPELLHRKLDPKQAKIWRDRFSGRENPVDLFRKVSVKAGRILAIERHPDAENLYVEKIDVGETEPRQIVSGLVKHYRAEELLGKNVLVVANLKAAKLRGVLSQGMLLAAEDQRTVEVLTHEAEIGKAVAMENLAPKETSGEIDVETFLKVQWSVRNSTAYAFERKLTLDGRELRTKKVESGTIR